MLDCNDVLPATHLIYSAGETIRSRSRVTARGRSIQVANNTWMRTTERVHISVTVQTQIESRSLIMRFWALANKCNSRACVNVVGPKPDLDAIIRMRENISCVDRGKKPIGFGSA